MNRKSGNFLTFLLGAVAGAAITWLFTSEEGKKIVNKAKEKGKDFKDEMEAEIEKGKSILNDLKNSLNNKNTPEAS